MMHSPNPSVGSKTGPGAGRSPLHRFLVSWHADIARDSGGTLASYIPELTKANPHDFGVSLTTIDGHTYAIGDSDVPFTIQSISKPFVFALALELFGPEKVEGVVGLEPSGDPFNSIRLRTDNRPYNPMVNSGAIACSGLIHRAEGTDAFDHIRATLSRFAGRDLTVDEDVFVSERETGDRNRAIAYLLRNYEVLDGDVGALLDVYFRQCSVLVTARDLGVMAATLANNGLNPVTGEQVMKSYTVARALSIMTSCGMYDYAGEWIYRIGMPAKSGVGGGVVAALPAQFGLGTFSPLLDNRGNSVRGVKMCEAVSTHFGLHMLARNGDVRSSIVADYNIGEISSRHSRKPADRQILEDHHREVRVVELAGALTFAAIDYLSRKLGDDLPPILILDFRRVVSLTQAAGLLIAEVLRGGDRSTTVITGMEPTSPVWSTLKPLVSDFAAIRMSPMLDQAIEWAEDQMIFRYGGSIATTSTTLLQEQPLLAGLSNLEIADLSKLATARSYRPGQCILSAGEVAGSLFFLQSGMVSVKLPSGVRLASLEAGMQFGEMGLLGETRSADVWADTKVTCLELPLVQFEQFRNERPGAAERIMRNLAGVLAKRLVLANAKIDLLSGY